jgi:hypothetical protein
MNRVMAGFPYKGSVRAEFMLAMDAVRTGADPAVAELEGLQSGPVLSKARNTITERFLESACDWLWFVDTDIVFSAGTLPALLKHADPAERPVISALYMIRPASTGLVTPAVYSGGTDPEGKFWFRPMHSAPAGELLRVAASGAGCLLIHRSVFTRLSAADPDDDRLWWSQITMGGRQFGEDLSFGLRCAIAGVPYHAHTGIRVGHMKAAMLGACDP